MSPKGGDIMSKTNIGLFGLAVAISSLGLLSALREKARADSLVGDVEKLIEQNQEIGSIARSLHLDKLREDYDLLASTIIWIDYKKQRDYLSDLLGDKMPRKDLKSHRPYTKADLDELISCLKEDEMAYHEAIRIVSNHIQSSPMEIFSVTPMNCLYAYL